MRILILLSCLLGAAACTTTAYTPNSDMAAGGKIAFGQPCTIESTMSAECATGLCTKTSYDKSTTPFCTYACTNDGDMGFTNPNCPMGCNPKGYCKIQQ